MRRFARNNGLSLVTFAFFLLFLIGQGVMGWLVYREDQQEHGETAPGYIAYLVSPHFVEATSENWESEFLQMGMFVLFTVWLHQKGSAESKRIGKEEEVDRDPDTGDVPRDRMPAPVRIGGVAETLYSHSLSIALLTLFAFSFAAHVWSGAILHSREELAHGGEAVSALGYLKTSRLWFESFQNWQSEFLAVFALSVLGIWLREKGSPESKPVDAPHDQTSDSSEGGGEGKKQAA
ncbi:MAG TPA: DUF6766 family protein [Chloroflexota bacterium]|nr:DUF6766 family protein [Chloroflexota bacterium]